MLTTSSQYLVHAFNFIIQCHKALGHAEALRVSGKEAQVFLCFVIKGFFLLCLFALYSFAPLRESYS